MCRISLMKSPLWNRCCYRAAMHVFTISHCYCCCYYLLHIFFSLSLHFTSVCCCFVCCTSFLWWPFILMDCWAHNYATNFIHLALVPLHSMCNKMCIYLLRMTLLKAKTKVNQTTSTTLFHSLSSTSFFCLVSLSVCQTFRKTNQ